MATDQKPSRWIQMTLKVVGATLGSIIPVELPAAIFTVTID